MATSKPRIDRRIVRSRTAILSAFERLLMEKPLADITVSAIAREANVDRKVLSDMAIFDKEGFASLVNQVKGA